MRRSRVLLALAVPAVILAGCADDPEPSASDDAGGDDVVVVPDDDQALALVATDTGLAAVPLGSNTPRWSAEGAVAALDGTAVFSATAAAGETTVRELDPRTGEEL